MVETKTCDFVWAWFERLSKFTSCLDMAVVVIKNFVFACIMAKAQVDIRQHCASRQKDYCLLESLNHLSQFQRFAEDKTDGIISFTSIDLNVV